MYFFNRKEIQTGQEDTTWDCESTTETCHTERDCSY